MMVVIFRWVMIVFLTICLGVHVVGLIRPFSSEPVWSHIAHLLSYALCMYCVVRPPRAAWLFYTIGAIYPFVYHARCAWSQYMAYGQPAAICILVVVLMPAGWWLVRTGQKA